MTPLAKSVTGIQNYIPMRERRRSKSFFASLFSLKGYSAPMAWAATIPDNRDMSCVFPGVVPMWRIHMDQTTISGETEWGMDIEKVPYIVTCILLFLFFHCEIFNGSTSKWKTHDAFQSHRWVCSLEFECRCQGMFQTHDVFVMNR